MDNVVVVVAAVAVAVAVAVVLVLVLVIAYITIFLPVLIAIIAMGPFYPNSLTLNVFDLEILLNLCPLYSYSLQTLNPLTLKSIHPFAKSGPKSF